MTKDEYHLNINPQKRNVFVTQLIDKDDEEDVTVTKEDVKEFAVLAESAAALLDASPNTSQQTALLRKNAELREVDKELSAKRAAFQLRMEAIGRRAEKLKHEREKLRNRMVKFEMFVRENNLKRDRAVMKFEAEQHEKEMKAVMLMDLQQEVEETEKMCAQIKKKVEDHKIFESYLQNVIDELPPDFLEITSDNLIPALITRHEGLCATKEKLEERDYTVQEELHTYTKALEDLKMKDEIEKVSCNREISHLQSLQEAIAEKNRGFEQTISEESRGFRTTLGELGAICMGIDNMVMKVRKYWGDPKEVKSTAPGSYVHKLSDIGDFIVERQQVVKLVEQMQETGEILPPVESQQHASTNTSYGAVKSSGDYSPSKLPPITKQRRRVNFNESRSSGGSVFL